MTRPGEFHLSHPIPVADTPPTEPAMPPSTPRYVHAFCGKLAAEHPDPLAQHPHVCLQPRGHVADGTYLRLDPAQWALISSYHDGSGITGAWGPFPTEEAAQAAQAALLNAGIDLHRCTIEPIRQVVNQP